jgi:hypothetical protein
MALSAEATGPLSPAMWVMNLLGVTVPLAALLACVVLLWG